MRKKYYSPTAKYRNTKIEYEGETFDSRKEYLRFLEFKLLEETGEITKLRRQVSYELIPSQKVPGKRTERACSYIADFVYENKSGVTIVEDTKSPPTRTAAYIIKRKLMLERYGISIVEI